MNTTYFLNLVAGNLFRTKTNPPIPSEMWIGLSTTAPNADGTNVTEPSTSTGYSRMKLDTLGEPVDGVVTNKANIDFNESTASWGTLTHFVIFDSKSGGKLLQYDRLTTPRSVETATIMTIKSGYLKLSVLNPS